MYQDPSQAANDYSETPRCPHCVLAPNALHTSCHHKCLPRLQKLRLPRRMYSSRATALTPQLPCRSTGPWFRHMVHHPGSETTVTDDDQNSKHNQYATRRNNRSWLDLPLEIPTLLLGRTAMAGHICNFVSTPVSGTVNISRTARRVTNHYRVWAARRYLIQIQRHVRGEREGYSY